MYVRTSCVTRQSLLVSCGAHAIALSHTFPTYSRLPNDLLLNLTSSSEEYLTSLPCPIQCRGSCNLAMFQVDAWRARSTPSLARTFGAVALLITRLEPGTSSAWYALRPTFARAQSRFCHGFQHVIALASHDCSPQQLTVLTSSV